MNRRSFGLSLALAAMGVSSSARGRGRLIDDPTKPPWGTIRGQFIIKTAKGGLPPRIILDVNSDRDHCLAEGPIFSEKWVVDPKTKGVRWVVVWIAPEKDGVADHKSNPAIHPSLKEIKEKQIEFKNSRCKYVPHVGVLRVGQDFVVRNSSAVVDNAKIDGENGVVQNHLVAPDKEVRIAAKNWKAHHLPSMLTSSIHPWMRATMFVFGHPYFAISKEDGTFEIKNAPAGKLRILMWHEEIGWLHSREPGKKGFNGQGITVESGKTLDLGKIPVKYEE